MNPEEARAKLKVEAEMCRQLMADDRSSARLPVFMVFDYMLRLWVEDVGKLLDMLDYECREERQALAQYVAQITPRASYALGARNSAAGRVRQENITLLNSLEHRLVVTSLLD